MPAQLPDIRPRMEPTERNKSKDDDARKEKEKKAAEELQAKASAKYVSGLPICLVKPFARCKPGKPRQLELENAI